MCTTLVCKFRLVFYAFVFLSALNAHSASLNKQYQFIKEPIDVVIPSVEKDLHTLNLCIEGIRQHGANIRRVIVVSKSKFTNKSIMMLILDSDRP